MAIDVGSAAIDRASNSGSGNTYIPKNNSANADGTLDTIEMWPKVTLENCEVGTVYLVSGTTFHCREGIDIGGVTQGSKQTFSGLDIDILTGDYLAYYVTFGTLERDSSGGAGYWFTGGSYVNTDDETSYSLSGTMADYSLYGTGTETPTGWANKFNGVANAAIGKINGVAIANVKQVNGVA